MPTNSLSGGFSGKSDATRGGKQLSRANGASFCRQRQDREPSAVPCVGIPCPPEQFIHGTIRKDRPRKRGVQIEHLHAAVFHVQSRINSTSLNHESSRAFSAARPFGFQNQPLITSSACSNMQLPVFGLAWSIAVRPAIRVLTNRGLRYAGRSGGWFWNHEQRRTHHNRRKTRLGHSPALWYFHCRSASAHLRHRKDGLWKIDTASKSDSSAHRTWSRCRRH